MRTAPLQRAIEAAQVLTPREKYQLIEAVAHSLAQADALEVRSATFIRGRTLDDLIAEQQPPVVTDLDALAADFWPEDESADDINDYIEAQRYPIRQTNSPTDTYDRQYGRRTHHEH